MKFIWFFLALSCLAANVSALNVPLLDKARIILGDHKVNFLLYTKSNPDKEQELEPTSESIKNSNYNPAHETIFFIHGWQQDNTTYMNADMRHAYFLKGDFNFIFVFWEDAGLGYIYAKNKATYVAERLANMFDHLVLEQNVPRSSITLVGHSLGAHIAGVCGKKVKSGKVVKMYGLDPASPNFHLVGPEKRFGSQDADYTVQITTNAHQLGFAQNLAKLTIYVNGGHRQPGCGLKDYVTGLCSHRRSVDVFVESLSSSKFVLVKCENYKQALASKCGQVLSNYTLGGENDKLLESEGVYHLHTNDQAPFATGTA